MIEKTFVNEDLGICSKVVKTETGYAVVVRDLDSGLQLPSARIFPVLDRAIEYAKKCVKGG